MPTPEAFAEQFLAAHPDPNARMEPQELEQTMRPLAPISYDTYTKIGALLQDADSYGSFAIGNALSWLEANYVVSPEVSEEKEWAVKLLVMDPCPGVVRYLPDAVKHAEVPVDERILRLLQRG